MPTPARLFISYRTDDTAATASRLAHELALRFGPEAVFLAHKRIQGGENWPQRLRDEVTGARVVLVLLGARWLTLEDDKTGRPRVENPQDWVRQEIEAALAAGRDVLPVRVDEAPPLGRAELAHLPSMAPLADLHACRLRHDEWERDFAALMALLEQRGFEAPAALAPTRRRWVWAGVAGALAVVSGLGLWLWRDRPAADPVAAGGASSVSQAPSTPAGEPATPSPASGPVPTLVPVTLAGTVAVPRHAVAAFAERHGQFTIDARAGTGGPHLGSTRPGPDGRFDLNTRLPEDASATLSWAWSAPDRHVLWPIEHPSGRSPFDAFAFDLVDNVYFREKSTVLRHVRAGDFAEADRRLRGLLQLIDLYGEPEQLVMPGWPRGRLAYKLLQEVCDVAVEQRATGGRSTVADAAIKIERQWRKLQFRAARRSTDPARNLAAALNAWAQFSREVYSAGQDAWPARPVLGDATALAAGEAYPTWLHEDLVEVAGQLQWLHDEAALAPRWRRLNAAQRDTMALVQAGDVEALPMATLASLLKILATSP